MSGLENLGIGSGLSDDTPITEDLLKEHFKASGFLSSAAPNVVARLKAILDDQLVGTLGELRRASQAVWNAISPPIFQDALCTSFIQQGRGW